MTNKTIEQLIAALNEGRSETLTRYLAALGRFHPYCLRNVMLIASQKPAATHVAGFHSRHKLGRLSETIPLGRSNNDDGAFGESLRLLLALPVLDDVLPSHMRCSHFSPLAFEANARG